MDRRLGRDKVAAEKLNPQHIEELDGLPKTLAEVKRATNVIHEDKNLEDEIHRMGSDSLSIVIILESFDSSKIFNLHQILPLSQSDCLIDPRLDDFLSVVPFRGNIRYR